MASTSTPSRAARVVSALPACVAVTVASLAGCSDASNMEYNATVKAREWASVKGGGMCNQVSDEQLSEVRHGTVQRYNAETFDRPAPALIAHYSYRCYVVGYGTRAADAVVFLARHPMTNQMYGWIGDETVAMRSASAAGFR